MRERERERGVGKGESVSPLVLLWLQKPFTMLHLPIEPDKVRGATIWNVNLLSYISKSLPRARLEERLIWHPSPSSFVLLSGRGLKFDYIINCIRQGYFFGLDKKIWSTTERPETCPTDPPYFSQSIIAIRKRNPTKGPRVVWGLE